MLGKWQTYDDYRELVRTVGIQLRENSMAAAEWRALHPQWRLIRRFNLDPVHAFLADLFPDCGRPSSQQPQILRSFVLMSLMGYTSVTNWVHTLQQRPLLALMIGCDTQGICGSPDKVPSVGAHYNFQERLWVSGAFERQHAGHSLDALMNPMFYSRIKKVSDEIETQKKNKKLKKGEKLQESNQQITSRLAEWAESDRDFPLHYEKRLQDLFVLTALKPSIAAGVLPSENVTVSGDGTAIHIHSDPCGHRPKLETYQALPYDQCPRFFQDPEATFGWDSDLGVSYFGYTLYMYCVHNAEYGIDLPVHIRVSSAARNDAVTGIIGLHEFLRLNTGMTIQNVCLDSAHDNMATYKWLLHNNIVPFIDLNDKRGRKKTVEGEPVPDAKGIPQCMAGYDMVRSGNDYSRMRTKYRCPMKCGYVDTCPCQDQCSPSPYGRTVYVNMEDNPRLYPPVPRDSDAYKHIYNNRTSCERCNKRVLHDFNLEQWRGHSRMRCSFMSTIAGICMHLQAQEKIAPTPDEELQAV